MVRHLSIAVVLSAALGAAPALGGKAGGGGGGAAPKAVVPDTGKEAGAATGGTDARLTTPQLGHAVIAGTWTGTVEEVGTDPYGIRLELKRDGTGAVTYDGGLCGGRIVPLAGDGLRYRETIELGREHCDDGYVRLDLRGRILLWTWAADGDEVRAAATLRRSDR